LFDGDGEAHAQGKSIIFITHKLKEVLRVADRIMVLRGGKDGWARPIPKSATQESLAAMMVGREVILTVDKDARHAERSGAARGYRVAKDDLGHTALRGRL
jgi:ABC-type uncharacterized transport system ATPase subunit